jgi:hypothetical protein
MTLVSVTAYHSFGGEVEALNTPTIRRLTPSCRHQLPRITLAAALFTFALAGFSAWQVAETRRTYGPIKESADAAKAQSEANRDQVAILKSQLRANLKVRIESATINQDSKPVAWIFTPVWTNAGGTDAVQASGWDDIEFFDSAIPDSFDFLTARHPPGQAISVTQGDEFMQPTKSLSAEQVQKIIDQKGNAIIWGHIEYGDVFPKSPRHHIHYCLRVFPANIGTLISFPLYKSECNYRD